MLPVGWVGQVFDADGRVVDDDIVAQLTRVGSEVVRVARQMAAHGTCDYADRPELVASPRP